MSSFSCSLKIIPGVAATGTLLTLGTFQRSWPQLEISTKVEYIQFKLSVGRSHYISCYVLSELNVTGEIFIVCLMIE